MSASNTYTGGTTLTATGTLELGALNAAGTGNITFASGAAATILADDAALGNGNTLPNTILGFASGDTIDLTGLSFNAQAASAVQNGQSLVTLGAEQQTADATTVRHATVHRGKLLVTNTNGDHRQLLLRDVPDGTSVDLRDDGHGGTLVTLSVDLACFAAGTRIATTLGNVAVEALSAGGLVLTISGAAKKIVWIGHRHVACNRHPEPVAVQPVRVVAGAFGEGMPARDLFLSPDHAVLVEGVLIPIRQLLNGTTVAQQQVDHVTYYHVELEQHDVLLAEGLPAESYLDSGDRASFANGGGALRLHPQFGSTRDAMHVWEALGYAPLTVVGEKVEKLRRKLRHRAHALRASAGSPTPAKRKAASAARLAY